MHGRTIFIRTLVATILLGLVGVLPAPAAPLRLGVQPNTVKKFEILADYLTSKGLPVTVIPYGNGAAAVAMAEKGQLDLLVAGSGLGATLIAKGLASPLARPVDRLGRSTYWAVLVAPKGSKPFDGRAGYFNGKRIAFTIMASSGEFFYRATPGIADVKTTIREVATHQEAIELASKGEVDLAIVKNTAWLAARGKYPNLVEIGSDGGQNPNDTIVAGKTLTTAESGKLLTLLLGVGKDESDAAARLKEGLGVMDFTITTVNDFSHTFGLMRRAGALP